MGDRVHQVQEGGVLVEDVVERRSFQAEILEEEMEQTDDSREEEEEESAAQLRRRKALNIHQRQALLSSAVTV